MFIICGMKGKLVHVPEWLNDMTINYVGFIRVGLNLAVYEFFYIKKNQRFISIELRGIRIIFMCASTLNIFFYYPLYRKHHRVKEILIESLPHSKYIKIIKSIVKTIFDSLCYTYEGNL